MAFSLYEVAVNLHMFRSASDDAESAFLEREESNRFGFAVEPHTPNLHERHVMNAVWTEMVASSEQD